MVKVILLMARRRNMSREDFERHLRQTYLPMAMRLPELRRLVVDWSLLEPHAPPAPYDVIVEDWFDDPVTMGIAFTSPEGQAIAADAPNFLDRTQFELLIVQEEEIPLPPANPD